MRRKRGHSLYGESCGRLSLCDRKDELPACFMGKINGTSYGAQIMRAGASRDQNQISQLHHITNGRSDRWRRINNRQLETGSGKSFQLRRKLGQTSRCQGRNF